MDACISNRNLLTRPKLQAYRIIKLCVHFTNRICLYTFKTLYIDNCIEIRQQNRPLCFRYRQTNSTDDKNHWWGRDFCASKCIIWKQQRNFVMSAKFSEWWSSKIPTRLSDCEAEAAAVREKVRRPRIKKAKVKAEFSNERSVRNKCTDLLNVLRQQSTVGSAFS